MTTTLTPENSATTKRKDIHNEVTSIIIKQLEEGVVPWQQSWTSKTALGMPRNDVTGNYYRGINIILLWCANLEKQYTSSDWASYKQWGSKGEYIRKGEKGNIIVYADTFEKEVEGEMKKIPFLKYSVVFNRCQLDSYNPKIETDEVDRTYVDRIKELDDFISNTGAHIRHHDGDAYYETQSDTVYLPYETSFIDTPNCSAMENYYSVTLHELTHWTGHSIRLDRKIKNKFGTDAYAEEELIAELGSAFLTTEYSISSPEKVDHASYIANWLRVLKNNKHFVISAASEASKAVEYMKCLQPT